MSRSSNLSASIQIEFTAHGNGTQRYEYISRALRLYGMRFETRRQAMDEVIDWLTYCNHRRLYSARGFISLMQYEQNWFAAQLKDAA